MSNKKRQNNSHTKKTLKKKGCNYKESNMEEEGFVQEKIKNPGYYFWRGYFDDLKKVNKNEQNSLQHKLCEYVFEQSDNSSSLLKISGFGEELGGFDLKTIYPGLVTGIGLPHETSENNPFILGFCFDYTTGLPIIPGSTVKGILRSVFPQWERQLKEPVQKKEAKTEYIYGLLKRIKEGIGQDKKELIIKIENEIFEGIVDDKTVSIYKRDLFFDAYIVKGTTAEPRQNLIFGTDNITPHVKEEMSYEESMLKNPVPLSFLKILPDVVFHFPFYLTDGEILKKEEKEKLFKLILLDIGIGAKTNVGYGQLEE